MAYFALAIGPLLDEEGRIYTNVPGDDGGPTKFGITRLSLQAFRGKTVTAGDVMALTEEEATEFYRKLFWSRMLLDDLVNQNVAYFLFDFAVNQGASTIVFAVQEALGLKPDGRMGPQTVAAVNAQKAPAFLASLLLHVITRYCLIVESRPTQAKFIRGWCARALRILPVILKECGQ